MTETTETLPHRSKDEPRRREWQEACDAFHAYRRSAFELERPDVLQKVRLGIESWRSEALLFLEVDPWFFRSGYLKQRLLRALKGAALNPAEIERLNGIFLRVIDSRDRREFKEYCRLAARLASRQGAGGL